MCGVPAAALVVSIISSVAAYQGQQVQAKNQQAFAKEQAQAGQAAARRDFDLQNATESQRQLQEAEGASQAVQQVQREAAMAKASTRVAAGEAGVAGLSVDQLLSEFDQQESAARYNINRNRAFSVDQSQLARQGIAANANQNIGRTRYAPIGRPSLLATGLQVAGSALGGYAKYKPQ